MSDLQPLAGELLVEIDDRVEAALGAPGGRTASGLYVATPKMQGVPISGTVYAVGHMVLGIKPGDRVMFTANQPQGFRWEGKRLFRLQQTQIDGCEAKA